MLQWITNVPLLSKKQNQIWRQYKLLYLFFFCMAQWKHQLDFLEIMEWKSLVTSLINKNHFWYENKITIGKKKKRPQHIFQETEEALLDPNQWMFFFATNTNLCSIYRFRTSLLSPFHLRAASKSLHSCLDTERNKHIPDCGNYSIYYLVIH